ncbi:MAG: glycosyltransferase family 2 protein, partial [Anaerolineae bacterium]
MPPAASVVIPNYNGVSLLPGCLDALRRQSRSDFETIVVDDASTDGSLALLSKRYPEVRLVPLARNRGFTGAVNAGIAAAQGETIVLLNSDTEATPAWLEALLGAFAVDPGVGMVASRMMLFDRRDVFHSAGDLYGRDGIPRNRGVWQQDRGQYDASAYVFGPCGGAAAYSRAMLEQVGTLDERLHMYLEDVDMAWRGQLRGFRCLYAPDARLYHMLSATGGGHLSSYYTGRNTIAVIAKDVPGPLLRRYWPRMLRAQLRVARDAVRAWRGEAARARLRGQFAGLRLAAGLRQARRQT